MTAEHAPPRRLGLTWWRFARGVVTGLTRAIWRVRITGGDNVPTSGAYVLAPVHRSFIDTFLCACLTPRRLRFVGKDSMWRYGWSGRLMTSLGGIPVHRGMPDREALRACEAAVRAGEPVVLFPEGTRQSGPTVRPLFEGAAFVAGRTGVPIVPVGIGGSEWAMPKGQRRLNLVRIRLVVGPPLDPPGRTGGAGRVSRRAVHQTSDALHHEIQRLFDQALAQAGRSYPPRGG